MNNILKSVLDKREQTNLYLIAGTFVSLHSSDVSNWIVISHGRPSEFIYMTPIHSFQSPISGPGYSVTRYKVSKCIDSDVIEKDTNITVVNRELIPTFSILRKSGLDELIDINEDLSGSKSFSLRVNSNPISPFQVNFDRKTLKTFGITPVDPMSSNLTTIFDLLADAADETSIDYLVPFSKHPLHFVRWQAIRAVFSIDEETGIDLIETACSDPHQQVSCAAKQTLRQLGFERTSQ